MKLRSGRWLSRVSVTRVATPKQGSYEPPSSSPERDGNQPSSATDGNEVGNRAACAGRVQWTSSLDISLLEIYRELGPRPRHEDLERAWTERHPQFHHKWSALARRYYRIRNCSEYTTVLTAGSSSSTSGAEEPRTASAERSPVVSPDGLESSQVPSPQGLEEEQDQEFGDQQPQDDQDEVGSQRPVDTDEVNLTEPSGQLDKLREEFLKVLREVRKGGEGDLKARKRPACQGIRVDPDLLRRVDGLIHEFYESGGRSWWELNCLVYAGAVVVENRTRKSLQRPGGEGRKDQAIRDKEADIVRLRRKIGWLTSELSRRRCNRVPTRRQVANKARLQRMFGVQNLQEMAVQLETEKTCLRVRSLQLRKLRDGVKRKLLNERYRRQGPRALGAGQTPLNSPTPPTADQITEYWSGVVGVPGTCDLSDPAIRGWQEGMGNLPEPTWEEPSPAVWRSALRRARSWKAPGPDGVHAFWWKVFPKANAHLWEAVKGTMDGESEVPDWFVRGRTVLIPKEGCQGRPDQYRPITCLNTGYKLFTAVLTTLLRQHVDEHEILPPEQKALRPRRRGCLDALVLDTEVAAEARRSGKDLSVAWVDYSKAYDRVPHSWLVEMLTNIKAPRPIRRCIENLILKWRSTFGCGVGRNAVKVDLEYRRGLFQGDSLSPLLFCLSIAPLSHELRKHSGFRSSVLEDNITHTMFMDDLKLYASGKTSLEQMLTLVDRVSQAVGMQLGLTKCAVAHLVK